MEIPSDYGVSMRAESCLLMERTRDIRTNRPSREVRWPLYTVVTVISTYTEVGVSDGFLVFPLAFWNPRKQTKVSLSFLTYAPDGLLFYLGKDVSIP